MSILDVFNPWFDQAAIDKQKSREQRPVSDVKFEKEIERQKEVRSKIWLAWDGEQDDVSSSQALEWKQTDWDRPIQIKTSTYLPYGSVTDRRIARLEAETAKIKAFLASDHQSQ